MPNRNIKQNDPIYGNHHNNTNYAISQDTLDQIDLITTKAKYFIIAGFFLAMIAIMSLLGVVFASTYESERVVVNDEAYIKFKKCMEDQTTGISCSTYLSERKSK